MLSYIKYYIRKYYCKILQNVLVFMTTRPSNTLLDITISTGMYMFSNIHSIINSFVSDTVIQGYINTVLQ